MRLIALLEGYLKEEESLFRAQLLREDIARLRRLEQLAREAPDVEAFKRAGLRIGWTQGDARTGELREPLERLLELVYGYYGNPATEEQEDAIEAAWSTVHRTRIERLVGCLATPTPRP